jgi:glycosyltransferase involved in cell wall biosynthesis
MLAQVIVVVVEGLNWMRVLHLSNHCLHGHGNVHLAVDLACIQASNGDSVSYAGGGGDYVALLEKSGVRHFSLTQRSKNPFTLAVSLIRLLVLVRRYKYDIVHAHMMAGAVFGFIATRFSKARLITTVHNSFDKHSNIMKLGDEIVVVSDADRAELLKRGFKQRKLHVILNATLGGVRATFLPESLIFQKPAGIVITTVCGLHSRKGVDFLITAFSKIAAKYDATLCIVGDGPDKRRLKNQARSLGLCDRIIFFGELNDPAVVLDRTDIFVLASLAEPLGLVNIEARRAGCAIIASDVGGVREALDDGYAGALTRAGDANDLAEKLETFMEDPALLSEMKLRAASCLERFSIQNLYASYKAVYQKLG